MTDPVNPVNSVNPVDSVDQGNSTPAAPLACAAEQSLLTIAGCGELVSTAKSFEITSRTDPRMVKFLVALSLNGRTNCCLLCQPKYIEEMTLPVFASFCELLAKHGATIQSDTVATIRDYFDGESFHVVKFRRSAALLQPSFLAQANLLAEKLDLGPGPGLVVRGEFYGVVCGIFGIL